MRNEGLEKFIVTVFVLGVSVGCIGYFFKGNTPFQIVSLWLLLVSLVVALLPSQQSGKIIAYTVIGVSIVGIAYVYMSFLRSASIMQNSFLLCFVLLVSFISYVFVRTVKDKPEPIGIFLDRKVIENKRYEKEINAIPVKSLPSPINRESSPTSTGRAYNAQERAPERAPANNTKQSTTQSRGVDSIGQKKVEYDLRENKNLDDCILEAAESFNLNSLESVEMRKSVANAFVEEGIIAPSAVDFFDEYVRKHLYRLINLEKKIANS